MVVDAKAKILEFRARVNTLSRELEIFDKVAGEVTELEELRGQSRVTEIDVEKVERKIDAVIRSCVQLNRAILSAQK